MIGYSLISVTVDVVCEVLQKLRDTLTESEQVQYVCLLSPFLYLRMYDGASILLRASLYLSSVESCS